MRILKKGVTRDAISGDDGLPGTQPDGLIDIVAVVISSGFFVGYFPVASGTIGSLWVPVLYYLIPYHLFYSGILIALPFLYFLGVWSSSRCEAYWGRDPGRVIIDEVVGMLVTLLLLPLNVKIVWMGFFLFRVFDIVKIPPSRRSEKLPRGWGVMTDDLIAGVYANLVLRIIIYAVPLMT